MSQARISFETEQACEGTAAILRCQFDEVLKRTPVKQYEFSVEISQNGVPICTWAGGHDPRTGLVTLHGYGDVCSANSRGKRQDYRADAAAVEAIQVVRCSLSAAGRSSSFGMRPVIA